MGGKEKGQNLQEAEKVHYHFSFSRESTFFSLGGKFSKAGAVAGRKKKKKEATTDSYSNSNLSQSKSAPFEGGGARNKEEGGPMFFL